MKREDQVKICSNCTLRKMNFKRGLLCGLTDEFADFEDSCPDFIKEERIVQKENKAKAVFS